MNTGQFKKGQPSWNAGIHLSGMSGKHHTESSKAKISEANKKENPKSSITVLLRRSIAFKAWREAVFERDGYTCQLCGAKQGTDKKINLHPHHLQSVALHRELIFDVSNGQTLCSDCHGKIHNVDFNGLGRRIICAVCGKSFKPKYGNYSIGTCSKKCGYILRTVHGSGKKGKHYPHLQRARIAHCLICGKEFRAVKDSIHRHQKYCSQECYLKARWNFTGRKAIKC